MKKLSWLAVLAVLLLGASCRPQYIFYPVPPIEDEDENVNEAVERVIIQQFFETFNPRQAWIDSESGRGDIRYEDNYADSASLSLALSERSDFKGVIRTIYFDGYKQSEHGLAYNGSMVFSVNTDNANGKDGMTLSIAAGDDFSVALGGSTVRDIIIEVETKVDGITITQTEAGKIEISIPENTFEELPETTKVSSPSMNGESITKAESDLNITDIDTETAIRNFDLHEILLSLVTSNKFGYPDGMSVPRTEVRGESLHESGLFVVELNNYVCGDYTVSGKINVEFFPEEPSKANAIRLVSYKADTDGDIVVKQGSSDNGFLISFSDIKGSCNVSSSGWNSSSQYFSNVKNKLNSAAEGTFIVNGDSATVVDIYGNGTPENPRRIATGTELVDFYSNSDNYSKCVALVDDIDLSGIEWVGNGHGGYPRLSGHFDGQGHSISNWNAESGTGFGFMDIEEDGIFENAKFSNVDIMLTSNGGNPDYLAIFPENHGTIQNVSIDDQSTIQCGAMATRPDIGGLVGYNGPTGKICNVSNSATINLGSDTDNTAGGIAAVSDGIISNAINRGSIGSAYVDVSGGIVGRLGDEASGASLTNVINYGNVTAELSAGGIVGKTYNGDVSISGARNEGTVSITHDNIDGTYSYNVYASGIVGLADSPSDNLIISNVANSGIIEGVRIAGIAGIYNYPENQNYIPENIIIKGAANTGNLNGQNVAGICYAPNSVEELQITASYSTGDTEGTPVAYYGITNTSDSVCDACYYSDTQGSDSATGITFVDGTNITWSIATAAMNAALAGSGFSYSENAVDGYPALPEIVVDIPVLNY